MSLEQIRLHQKNKNYCQQSVSLIAAEFLIRIQRIFAIFGLRRKNETHNKNGKAENRAK